MIQTTNLEKVYTTDKTAVTALQDCTLHIQKGEQVAIMGKSGSGKSTLLYLLGGLEQPTGGTIVVNGQDVTAMNATQRALYRRQHIGFVFQSYHLIPEMTAQENILLPALLNGMQDAEKELDRLSKQLALQNRLSHYPSELSGGQQQRVAIARAVIHRPTVLLCDEPTGNLDTHTGQEVLDMLKQLASDQGITLVIVTHDPDVAKQMNRMLYIVDGRVEV